MSRSRPNSAQSALAIISLALTAGCSASGGPRWFAQTEPEVPATIASIEGQSRRLSDNEIDEAARSDDGETNQVATISDGESSQIQLASSRTTDAVAPPPVAPLPVAPRPEPLTPPGPTPPSADSSSSSIVDVARGALGALKFSIPGLAKPAEPDLAEEIAKFEKFSFEFELPTVAGETNGSHNFKGQLMVVDIWATWCGPCRKAIPDFVAIQDEFGPSGVQVIGITCDSDDPAEAAETARKAYAIGRQFNVNYPLLVDDGTTTKKVPGFRGYPTTLFVTPDGIVRYKVTGAQSKEKLAAMINAIMQK